MSLKLRGWVVAVVGLLSIVVVCMACCHAPSPPPTSCVYCHLGGNGPPISTMKCDVKDADWASFNYPAGIGSDLQSQGCTAPRMYNPCVDHTCPGDVMSEYWPIAFCPADAPRLRECKDIKQINADSCNAKDIPRDKVIVTWPSGPDRPTGCHSNPC